MSDTLSIYGERHLPIFNVLDEGILDGLAIAIDTPLPATRVIRDLEQAVSWRGQPRALRLETEYMRGS